MVVGVAFILLLIPRQPVLYNNELFTSLTSHL